MDYKYLLTSILLLTALALSLLFIFTPYKYISSGKGAIYKINRFTQEIYVIYGTKEMKVFYQKNYKYER